SACAQGRISPGLRSTAIFRAYGLFRGARQMPERSGLPSTVRGTGADRSGLPSGVRGIPGVLRLTHCADKEVDNRKAKVITTAAQKSFPFIESLLWTKKSEHQFQSKLNLARTCNGAGDLARRGTDALSGKDKEVRNTEVRPVCDVKGFGPEEEARFLP